MNLFVQLIGLTAALLHYGSVFVNGQSYVLTSSCGGVVTEGGSCVLTCETRDASQTGILWRKDANPSVRVDRASCTTSTPPFPSKYVLDCSGTSFTLNITNADSEQDAASWTCDFVFGGKESSSINTVVEVPLKYVQLTFDPDPVEEGKNVNVSCTTSACNPQANVSISFDGTKHNGPSSTVPQNSLFITVVSVMLIADATKNVSCSADNGGATISKELPFPVPKQTTTTLPASPKTMNNNSAAPVPVPEACGFALIAVIILVVLLVMKIATDVIFVGYRWGDRFGVKYKQICKQIIDTDKRKYILYWICFVQGIINSICGVTFFIVIFATCSESLGEGLPIAVIVIGIIVGSIGVINIVMCLCCCCCPKSSDPGKSDDPSPWLCCCCLGTIHPENKSSPDHPPPSSLPPIPPSMASPRKPPVPPSSTTPRALPSPTSDPASDSAVNPSVHLEPLSVEAPKKKKKKRKKRKTTTTTEAGEESSDQPMNPTGDSDE